METTVSVEVVGKALALRIRLPCVLEVILEIICVVVGVNEVVPRVVRRVPISQRRILSISAEEVVYQSKDTRTKSFIEKRCTPEQFVDLIAQHVPGDYRHSMRYFGLLAPTVKGRIGITVFALSNSTRRSKPKRQSWAASVQKHFGRDPLRDANGQQMRWIGSLPPKDMQ